MLTSEKEERVPRVIIKTITKTPLLQSGLLLNDLKMGLLELPPLVSKI